MMQSDYYLYIKKLEELINYFVDCVENIEKQEIIKFLIEKKPK